MAGGTGDRVDMARVIRTRGGAWATVALYAMVGVVPVIAAIGGRRPAFISFVIVFTAWWLETSFLAFIRIQMPRHAQRRAEARTDAEYLMVGFRPTWQGFLVFPPGPLVLAVRLLCRDGSSN
jgi:hypothetical protein